jgi:uncharacterized repeat protein (TIGR02543 family)
MLPNRTVHHVGLFAVGLVAAAWFVVGVASSASAATTTLGGITYTVDDAHPELGASVTGYAAGPTVIVIPGSVTIGSTDYPVTAIAASVFQNQPITSVTIPGAVTSIGDNAFNSDNQLSSLDLGSGVTTIGQYAFTNDGALHTLVLPNSVTSVGQWAFDSDDLTSLTLSSGLTEIATQAFSNENHLQSVIIPPGVTTIDFAAFAADDLRNLVIGSGVTTIGQYAFAYNNNLATVLIPPSVTSFGDQVFQNNSSGSLTATFQGAAPTTFGTNVFNVSNPLIQYDAAFGSPPVVGGFTSPTWHGYNTASIATIAFDANGHGTAPTSVTAPTGHVIPAGSVPSAPTASGYVFVGWFTAASGGTEWNFGTTLVSSDVVLFAHWDPATGLPATGADSTIGWLLGVAALLGGCCLVMWATRRRVPSAT